MAVDLKTLAAKAADPQKLVTDAAANATSAVAEQGGSFLGNFFSAPFRAVKGAFNHLWAGTMLTGGIIATKLFMPEYWRAGLHLIGGEKAADDTAAAVKSNGILEEVVIKSALEGYGITGALGAAQSAMQGNPGKSSNFGGSLGAFAGGAATILGVSAVGYAMFSGNSHPPTPAPSHGLPPKPERDGPNRG